MYSEYVFSVCLALLTSAALVMVAADGPAGRLFDGQPVDNLRQFPHHVYINVMESGQKCGGTILSDQWILTSASCVKHGIRIDLYFRKQQQYDIRGDFFSISVNRDQVFVYPTNYDDIALIKLPTALVFSESLVPVGVSDLPIEALRGRFAVMPGFSDFLTTTTTTTTSTSTSRTTTRAPTTPTPTTYPTNTPSPTYPNTWMTSTTIGIAPPSPGGSNVPMPATPAPTPPVINLDPPSVLSVSDGERHLEGGDKWDILKYGMFKVLDNRECKKMLGSQFDEYTQLCVDSWGDNPNRPCESDFGSGLIVGWPARSELVGLFSMSSPGCDSKLPTVFTFISKYGGWIEGLMREKH